MCNQDKHSHHNNCTAHSYHSRRNNPLHPTHRQRCYCCHHRNHHQHNCLRHINLCSIQHSHHFHHNLHTNSQGIRSQNSNCTVFSSQKIRSNRHHPNRTLHCYYCRHKSHLPHNSRLRNFLWPLPHNDRQLQLRCNQGTRSR